MRNSHGPTGAGVGRQSRASGARSSAWPAAGGARGGAARSRGARRAYWILYHRSENQARKNTTAQRRALPPRDGARPALLGRVEHGVEERVERPLGGDLGSARGFGHDRDQLCLGHAIIYPTRATGVKRSAPGRLAAAHPREEARGAERHGGLGGEGGEKRARVDHGARRAGGGGENRR